MALIPPEVVDVLTSPSPPTITALAIAVLGAFLALHLGVTPLTWADVRALIRTKCFIAVDAFRTKVDPKDAIIVTASYVRHNHRCHCDETNIRALDTVESCFILRPIFWISDNDDLLFMLTLFSAIAMMFFNPVSAPPIPLLYFVSVGYAKQKARAWSRRLQDVTSTCNQEHVNFFNTNGMSFIELG